jgi:hypothetical protein
MGHYRRDAFAHDYVESASYFSRCGVRDGVWICWLGGAFWLVDQLGAVLLVLEAQPHGAE